MKDINTELLFDILTELQIMNSEPFKASRTIEAKFLWLKKAEPLKSKAIWQFDMSGGTNCFDEQAEEKDEK